MKKLSTMLLTATLIMATAITSFAGEISVKVNGNKVNFPDAKPYTDENDRTLVPIRFIADELKAKTSWNEEKQVATIEKDEKIIDICIRCRKIFVNKKQVKTDSIGIKKNDRTFVPLRFISENFGAKVSWDPKTLTVTITTDEKVPQQTEMKELPDNLLPKDVQAKFHVGNKLYDGAGLECRITNFSADHKVTSLSITDNNMPLCYVVLTDRTWVRARGGDTFSGSLHGDYIGKEVDKLFLLGTGDDSNKNFLVDIPNVKITEKKSEW